MVDRPRLGVEVVLDCGFGQGTALASLAARKGMVLPEIQMMRAGSSLATQPRSLQAAEWHTRQNSGATDRLKRAQPYPIPTMRIALGWPIGNRAALWPRRFLSFETGIAFWQ